MYRLFSGRRWRRGEGAYEAAEAADLVVEEGLQLRRVVKRYSSVLFV